MKKYISSSVKDAQPTRAGRYSDYFVYERGAGKRYSVHMNQNDGYNFEASISKISPYDDADYVWAHIKSNGAVDYYKGGKKIGKSQLWSYEEDDYEDVAEYMDSCIDSVVVDLIDFNRSIEPVMVHN